MGIPKASRKGKKAWRKNIDAQEVEAFLTEESHKRVREPSVQTLKDEDLFVVDKAPDDDAVPTAVRKRKQHQQKLLRPQLILASHKDGIKPLHVPTKYKPKGPARPLPGSMPGGTAAAEEAAQAEAAAAAAAAAAKGRRKPARRRGLKVSDIWSEPGANPEHDWTALTSGYDLIQLGKRKQQQQGNAAASGGPDTQLADASAAAARAPKRSKRRVQQGSAGPVPAVEVDAPGCSFNPEPEAHQDALAAAVAAEYRKQLAEELAPKAPSQYAPAGYKKPRDELDELLVDAEVDDDEDDDGGQEGGRTAAAAGAAGQGAPQLPAAMHDENAIALDDDSDDEEAAAGAGAGGEQIQPAAAAAVLAGSRAARQGVERKTQKDRNKAARRKQQEAEAAAKAAVKQQRRELERLSELQEQLQAEEEEKESLRVRRQVVAAERAASEPPKLGKHRFEAPAVAVLTSDEVSGSLRQIKPCFLLAADRYKALQKRGLVEPRKPAGHKQGKRRVEYVTGERQERAREQQQEIEDIKKARKKASKSGSAEAAAAVVEMAGGKGSKRKKKRDQQRKAHQQQQKQLAPGSILPLDVAAGDGNR